MKSGLIVQSSHRAIDEVCWHIVNANKRIVGVPRVRLATLDRETRD